MDSELQRAWKEFGKQTEAGKLLYELYGVRYRPEQHVNYPKNLKMKPKTEEVKTTRPEKPTLKITYPEIRKKPSKPISMIDIIPRRKHHDDIKQQISEIKSELKKFKLEDKKPTNRKAEISKLQDKFQYQERTIMPKGARLPGLKDKDIEEVDEIIASTRPKNKKTELEYLYDSTLKDIDERYIYMEEMKKLGKDVDTQIMSEIRAKIDDLKHIQKLLDEQNR
jgi:hypothetical protein